MRFIFAILIVFFSTNCFAFWTKGTDTAPEVQTFCKRVLDDGGTVVDVEYMDKMVKLLKQLGIWSNVKFLADANFGVKLNGSGVTKFYDLSGNNTDATQGTVANQPIWSSGAITYDGTDDYLSLGNPAVLQNMAEGTLFIRFNRTATNATYQMMFTTDSSSLFEARFQIDELQVAIGSTGAQNLAFAYPTLNTPTLLVVPWSNAGNVKKLYLSSVERATNICTETTGTDPRRIGGRPALPFKGVIGSIFVFNIALTTAQRTAIERFVNSYYAIY